LNVTAKDPEGNEILSQVILENGQPKLQFSPKCNGYHKVEIFKGPEKLAEIPVSVYPAKGIVEQAIALPVPLTILDPEKFSTTPTQGKAPVKAQPVGAKNPVLHALFLEKRQCKITAKSDEVALFGRLCAS